MVKRFMCFLCAAMIILCEPICVYANTLTIPAGTAVTLYNEKEISADRVQTGQKIDFFVQNPVIINKTNVIKSGTIISAQVLKKKNNFIFGVPGEIQVGNFKLQTPNGDVVPLRGEIFNKGDGKYWCHISWIFCLGIISFFVKGEDGIIPAGSSTIVYTMNDITY